MIRILLLIVSLCASASASAGDRSGEWKLIAGDGSVTTSTCIGTYETVECLADSIAACAAWIEWPEFRRHGIAQLPAICDNIPGYVDGGPFWSMAPKDTELYLYKTDQWTLESAEDWLLYEDEHALARTGDTVLDFASVSCSPDPACLRTIDAFAPAGEILALCPRTYCIDSFEIYKTTDPAGKKVAYDYPFVTFLLRKQGREWRVVDFYHSGPYYGANGPRWLPDHWKRK